MIYYLLGILILTFVFWLLRKYKIAAFCPICAGTVLVWAGGIIAVYSNAAWANPLIVGILMGASMGALAEKYGSKLGLLWKTATVVLGLVIIYLVVQKFLYQALGLAVLFSAITLYFHKTRAPALRSHKDLFKDCC